LPQTWAEHGHVLQAEGQIRRIEVSDARRLRQLEDENGKLKRLLADSMLDNAILKDLLGKV
jgi:putative transposase